MIQLLESAGRAGGTTRRVIDRGAARALLLALGILAMWSGPAAARAEASTGALEQALPAAAPGSLSRTERTISAAVERQVDGALDLLERAVNINSGTLNPDGVRAVSRLFAPPFEAIGFRTRWVDGAAWGRAGHLIAERPGAQGALRVLLIGHLDTVFEPDSPFQRYERLSDDRARGPGVCDMKGGIVVMLVALRALSEAGALDGMSVTAVLTGDEERAGRPLDLARRDLVEAARGADVAIGFEDGAGDPRTPVISRRGSSTWALRVEAKTAHSSQIFREDVGSGAIFEAARILSGFHEALRGEPYLTLSPGIIAGGTTAHYDSEQARGEASGKTNVVAAAASVAGDLRALSVEQRDRARERMSAIAAASLPHARSTLSFDESYPPLAPSDGNRRLLEIYDGASRDLAYGGVTAVDPSKAGAADISFTQGLVPMAIDGIGLMGEGGHTVQEIADLRTLPMNAKRIALTLLRLAASRASDSVPVPARESP